MAVQRQQGVNELKQGWKQGLVQKQEVIKSENNPKPKLGGKHEEEEGKIPCSPPWGIVVTQFP